MLISVPNEKKNDRKPGFVYWCYVSRIMRMRNIDKNRGRYSNGC